MNTPLAQRLFGFFTLITAATCLAATNQSPLAQPLSIAHAVDIALKQNSAIRKSVADLEAAHGVVVQTRAITLPKVAVSSEYIATEDSAIDRFRARRIPGSTNSAIFTDLFDFADQRWSANVRVVQSIYEGGLMASALRTATLTREQALLLHQAVIADVIRDVRLAYYGVLLAQQQIQVQQASVTLLEQELSETRNRFNAGTVPKFNVLRAEVELANARPRLIRARNALRTSQAALAQILGESTAPITEDLALTLTDEFDQAPHEITLADAVTRAWEYRPELAALRKAAALQRESVENAKAGYKPRVQIFAGYGARSSQFSRDLTDELHGWEAGAQLNWNIFDGFLTQGRVREARALEQRATEDVADLSQKIELEVRTALSSFIEAREVLESQQKVQEAAEEALRLAMARAGAGSATQLDVLGAQTSLTEARTTRVQALHDYAAALARLQRAIGPVPGQNQHPAE